MGFWIGVAVVVAGGGQAKRNATGSTVTGNIQNDHGPSGF